ncbi:hypothetical protein [Halegenticoccus tardaugens]
MPREEESRFVGVHRPPALCHDDREIGEVDGDVVELYRVGVARTHTREDTLPRVNHDGDAGALTSLIEAAQSLEAARAWAVAGVVRVDPLVRRMEFDSVQREVVDRSFDDFFGVIGETRIKPAERYDSVGVRIEELRRPLVGVVGVLLCSL